MINYRGLVATRPVRRGRLTSNGPLEAIDPFTGVVIEQSTQGGVLCLVLLNKETGETALTAVSNVTFADPAEVLRRLGGQPAAEPQPTAPAPAPDSTQPFKVGDKVRISPKHYAECGICKDWYRLDDVGEVTNMWTGLNRIAVRWSTGKLDGYAADELVHAESPAVEESTPQPQASPIDRLAQLHVRQRVIAGRLMTTGWRMERAVNGTVVYWTATVLHPGEEPATGDALVDLVEAGLNDPERRLLLSVGRGAPRASVGRVLRDADRGLCAAAYWLPARVRDADEWVAVSTPQDTPAVAL